MIGIITVIKTRKRIILSAFSFIFIACLAGSSSSLWCNDVTENKQQFDVNLPQPAAPSHRAKRMRASSHKKQKRKYGFTFLDMTHDELLAAKNVQVERGNIAVAIKYLEQLMKLSTNITSIADYLLEMADLFFIDKQFQKASAFYSQYCTLYPGSEKQEYALYKSIASSFACILSSDRDQTKTEETVALTQQFLQQDHYTTYKTEVTQIQIQCYEQLTESECNICSFYIDKGNLTAAERRLHKMRADWLPKLPTIEPQLITLQAQIDNKKEELTALHDATITVAQNKRTKHMMERF
jgi:outer membrane assembly lipoprotein YfiO